MASSSSSFSSSSSSRTWKFSVFTSFHGPDVRRTFLSHLRKQFSSNGISMFNDQQIERSHTIAPALTQAIRESRISIVVLSEKYASSSWCLDELVEILECKEYLGQIVMTVFYGVDPSDVRNQTGDFGSVFKKTCARKTENESRKWAQALNKAGNIAGEHFLKWDNEADMIVKIAKDVSNTLNTTICSDFEDMVGIKAHLEKIQSLLYLEYEDVAMMVGISGAGGIGKTTIARALHSRLSSSFPLTCFMENVSGSTNRGLDDHGLKLSLQEKLLSKILNQNDMTIYNLGAIRERLHDQKVLIILDDVDDLRQLEALAMENDWFGSGSRIIIIAKDQELLEQHGISNTYNVGLPTKEETLRIFCRYAFRRSLAPDRFEKLAEKATELCSNLPLSLCILGSTLRGKNEEEWEDILHMQENSLDPDIERVIRAEYVNLHKDAQLLFLLIAFFFNDKDEDYVIAMLAGNHKMDVRLGLKTLKYKSLIQISTEGKISIGKLQQQMGREAIQRQESSRRQILIDTDEICDVLENDSGSGSVIGISLDMSSLLRDVYVSKEAFKRIRNLQFLHIYHTNLDSDRRVHVPKYMNFPPQLRLLHWKGYTRKCLPATFRPDYLVELNLQSSKLEKLWEEIQPLTNLKKISLAQSPNLKKLPDLSLATNLEWLDLTCCSSLAKLSYSIAHLQKLKHLEMVYCLGLQVVPTLVTLPSLESVNMVGCWELEIIPEIFSDITKLMITDTMLQSLLDSVRLWSRLQSLAIYGIDAIKPSMAALYLSRDLHPHIEKIPNCIKDLHGLQELSINGCPTLTFLPEFPASLKTLRVYNCGSLETLIPFRVGSPIEYIHFANTWKLGEEARRVITEASCFAWLPGSNLLPEFTHRAIGNFLILPSGTDKFRYCVVVSPKQTIEDAKLLLHVHGGSPVEHEVGCIPHLQADHLCISQVLSLGPGEELLLEFSTTSKDVEVIECGFQFVTDETNRSYSTSSEQVLDRRSEFDDLERLGSFNELNDPTEEHLKSFEEFDNPRVQRLKSLVSSYYSKMERKVSYFLEEL